jgi:conjugal transfer pilus assembly protein TraW
MPRFYLITLLLVIVHSVYAKDLGQVGQVYPIKEVDLLEFIQTRLKQMQQSGELDRLQKEFTEKSRKKADRPKPVQGISVTRKYRKWFIDPSTIVTNDIKNADGKVIIKAGTTVNPLSHASLRTTFIFYDGDDKSQVAWAINKDKELKGKTKVILVRGSLTEQFRLFKKKIFFDQYGRLVERLKIQHTPAIATQDEMQIRVEEVVS